MRLANAATRHWHTLSGEQAGAVALGHAVLACAWAHAQALYTLTRKRPDEGLSFL
jgi:hypothetical protein